MIGNARFAETKHFRFAGERIVWASESHPICLGSAVAHTAAAANSVSSAIVGWLRKL